MALQSSGQIKMSQLNTELNRGATDEFSISLAAEGGYEAINTNSTNKPNDSAPTLLVSGIAMTIMHPQHTQTRGTIKTMVRVII